MAKDKKQPRKRVSAKLIRDTEGLPPPPPVGSFAPHPEPEDDPWGKDGLTLKQRRFVKAYVGRAAGNATKAAELAGYNAENRTTLAVTASENLKKPNVQRAVARALSRRQGGPEWTRAGIVELARASMADFVTVDDAGNVMIDLRRAREAAAFGTVKKITVRPTEAGQQITLETYDRLSALQTLAKIHGTLTENHDHRHSGTVDLRNLTDADLADLERILLAASRRAGIPDAPHADRN